MFRIPSFLGPQIDLLEAAAKAVTSRTAKMVNVNKGQLLAPQRPALAHRAGHLHWLQHPGGELLQLYPAAGLGVRRLSMENHAETRSRPSPRALMVPMHRLEALLRQLMAIRPAVADSIVLCTL